MSGYDIITIGAASRDIFLRSADFRVINDPQSTTGKDECVALGSKIDIERMVVASGGGATNAAASFASFAFKTAFLGKVGADDDGNSVLRDLHSRKIDTTYVRRDTKEPTALSVLLSTLHKGRTVLIYRGASKDLSFSDLPLHRLTARWVYCTSLGGNLKLLARILRSSRRRKTPVFVNPGMSELRQRRTLLPLLSTAAIILLNREEANTLAGTTFLPVPEVIGRLAPHIPGVLIVTDEANGSWVRAGSWLYHSGTHRNLQVVERTGAGDAFGSGFLAGLLFSGGEIASALTLATANAESVMRHIGAKNGILRKAPPSRFQVSVSRTPILSKE